MSIEEILLNSPPSKPVRLACVGLGYIFRAAHSEAVRALQRRGWQVDFTVLCDRRQEAVDEALKAFPYAKGCLSCEEVLQNTSEFDALLIALWPPMSLTFMEQAIDSGVKAILVEKPVHHDPVEILRVGKKAADRGATACVAYNRLQTPALPGYMEISNGAKTIKSLRAAIHRANRSEKIFYEDVAPHAVGVLRRLMGNLTVQKASFGPPEGPNALPNSLDAVMKSESGAQVTLEMRPAFGGSLESYTMETGDERIEFFYIDGDNAPEPGLWHEQAGQRKFQAINPPTGLDEQANSNWRMGFLNQMAGFVRAAAGAGPLLGGCNLEEAAKIADLVEKILKTAANNGVLKSHST